MFSILQPNGKMKQIADIISSSSTYRINRFFNVWKR